MAGVRYTRTGFADLAGWADDDHQAALDVFGLTRGTLPETWPDLPHPGQTARSYFEDRFIPVVIEDGAPMLFTGYYEPELDASPEPDDTHRFPAYAVPPDLEPGKPYLSRRDIEEKQTLAGRGLELAWFADPVDLFFLQVQGSGRIRFPDGRRIRLGFAAKNGHPYTSIGRLLVSKGVLSEDQVSPDAIRGWVTAQGAAGRAFLWQNESFVFFRRIDDVPGTQGPPGALGVPVTAGRTLAVDPGATPLGAPVWIETAGATPIHRLMVAQDVGSAIKGAQRADVFFGTGDTAGRAAGALNCGGRMITLMPHAMADRLAGDVQHA